MNSLNGMLQLDEGGWQAAGGATFIKKEKL